jgi:Flp pilus assembly protein TadG
MLAKNFFKTRKSASLRRSRRGGTVILISAFAIISLLGFSALAVDYGLMVNDANRLQRACDASALAGATKLKQTGVDATDVYNAQVAIIATMKENGFPNYNWADLQFNAPLNNRVTVPASTTRNYFFGGVFRLINANSATSSQISRRAVAGRTALRGVPGVSPLAITTVDYEAYKLGIQFENQLIDNNRQPFIPGTLTALDLRLDSSGKSPTIWQTDLTWGTDRTTIIGEQINSAINAELANQGRRLEDSMDSRIERAAGAPWYDNGNTYTWPNIPADDPRIVTLMVADPNPTTNSNPQLTARFFISVYVDDVRYVPGLGVSFLKMRILPSSSYGSDNPNIIVGGDDDAITGPSVVRLMD